MPDWKQKKPKSASLPAVGKTPKRASTPEDIRRSPSGSPPSYNSEQPSWRISKIEMSGPFGWHEINPAKVDDIRTRLGSFESMTWNQILIEGKKQHHSVEVWRICKPAQERLHIIGLGDAETVVSLGLSGKERIWGIRQGVALLVLWWDPDHQICPSLLKHT